MSKIQRANERNVVYKKSGGFLGKVVALLLGLLLGIIAALGGLVGAGYTIVTQVKIEDNVNTIKGLAGVEFDYTKYINGEYGQKTVLDLVGDVMEVANSFMAGSGTLGALNDISPMVKPSLESVAQTLQSYGSNLSIDEITNSLLSTNMADIGGYIMGDLMDSMVLADLLVNTGNYTHDQLMNDTVMMLVCYGVKGETYDIVNGEVQMLNGATPTSIGSLMKNGFNANLEAMPLDMLFTPKDDTMRALAYGPASHYTKNMTTGEVTMNETVFIMNADGNLYDDQDKAYAITQDENGLNVITVNEQTYYVATDDPANRLYYAYKTVDTTTDPVTYSDPLFYEKVKLGALMDGDSDFIHDIEIAPILQIDNDQDNPILIAIAFGNDYIFDEHGNILGTSKTIGELLEEGTLDDAIYSLALEDLMTNPDLDDALIRSLLYGPSYQYRYYGKTSPEPIVMNQVLYTIEEESGLLKLYDQGENDISDTISSAEHINGTAVLKFIFKDGRTEYLKPVSGGYYGAYLTEECAHNLVVRYKPTTLSSLKDDPSSLFNNIEVGTALGIENKLSDNPSRILLALSYGKRGVDYEIDNEGTANAAVRMLGNAKKRTLKDLKERSDELIKEITIADAVNVTAKTHPVLIALAYGDSENYTVSGDTIIPNDYADMRTIDELSGNNSETLINSISLSDALAIKPDSQLIMRAIALGQKGVHYTIDDEGTTNAKIRMLPASYSFEEKVAGEGYKFYDRNGNVVGTHEQTTGVNEYTVTLADGTTQYAVYNAETGVYDIYKDATKAERALTKKTTLGDLSANGQGIIDGVTLIDALNITPNSSRVMLSLAYGRTDVDYKVVEENGVKTVVLLNGAKPHTIGEMRNKGDDLINMIYLSDIVDLDQENKVLMYLLYGKEGIHYHYDAAQNKDIMLQKRVTLVDVGDGVYHIYNEYGDVLLSTQVTKETNTYTFVMNGVTYQLAQEPDPSMQNLAIKPLMKVDIRNEEETVIYSDQPQYFVVNTDGTPAMFDHTHLGDLQGDTPLLKHLTDRLTVNEVLGSDVSSHKILKHLGDTLIADMPTAINELSVGQVFAQDIYVNGESGEVSPLWKYLLKDSSGNVNPDAYKIGDGLDALTSNMTRNIQGATLETLVKDDIVKFSDEQDKTDFLTETKYTDLRQMTIIQMLEFMMQNA